MVRQLRSGIIVVHNKLGTCLVMGDELRKSFSSDLQSRYPNGRWVTISDEASPMHGRHIYLLPHSDGTATVLVGGGPALRHKVMTLKQQTRDKEEQGGDSTGDTPAADKPKEEEPKPEPEKPKKPELTEEQKAQIDEHIKTLSQEIGGKKNEMFDFVKQQWGIDHELTPEDKQRIERQTEKIADPVEKQVAQKMEEKRIVSEKDKAIQDIIKAAKEAIISDDPAAQGGNGSVAAIVKEHAEVLVGAHMAIKALEKERRDLRKMVRIGKAHEKYFSGKEILADFAPLTSEEIVKAISDEKALEAELDAHYKLIKTVKGVGDEKSDELKGEKELVRNIKQGGYETFTGFIGKHTGQSITTKRLYDELGANNASILARHYLVTSGHKMPEVTKELEAYLSAEGNAVAKLANERGHHFMKVADQVRAFGHGSDNIMTAQQAHGTALRYTNKAYEAFGQAEGALNQGAELLYSLKGRNKEAMTWTAGYKDTLETKRKKLGLKQSEGHIAKNDDGSYTLTVNPKHFEKFIDETATEAHGSGLGQEFTPQEIMEGKANRDDFHPTGIKGYLDPDKNGYAEKVVMKQHEQAAAHLLAQQKKVYLNFEAGTGKSKTSLVMKAHLDDMHGKNHRMIVSMPKKLMKNYAEEVEKWSGYKVVRLSGDNSPQRRQKLYESSDGNTIFVVNHELMGIDKHHIDGKFDLVVTDEAHKSTQRQGRGKSLKSEGLAEVGKNAPYYVAMSGTPAQSDLSELYFHLNIADPEKYGSQREFMAKFGSAHKGVGYKEQVQDFLNTELGDRVFTLKKDIDAEMHHKVHRIEMSKEQRAEYKSIQDQYKQAGGGKKETAALARDQRLTYLLNGSDMDESHKWETNPKYKQLKGIIDDHLKNKGSSEKVAIYAKHKATLREIQRFLEQHYPEYGHVTFNGDTTKAQVESHMDKVRHDPKTKFSLHMRAGVEGLNLQHTKDHGGLTTLVTMASGEDAYAPLDQFFARGHRTGANKTIHGHTLLTVSPHDIGTELRLDEKKAVGELVRTDRKRIQKSVLLRRVQ